ncbi:aldehyde dehydrogenase [Achromobacter deleyi]|uniref:aldehyde dehydrogenase n=1 Tax=Achromobacter deleyi TaxID=1353891 RepID=UPI001490C013|nr:aldehyde dehydrogenase [Achromobacter deleyi]QVQ25323.1 aldehyde dehydrogenase [Achromobacter deleyi]UIP20865.1 aldehyde dehydrogenase [Achromobacter deleyi]
MNTTQHSPASYQLYIDGEWTDPASGEWFDTVEPYSGTVWARIPRGTAVDADRAVQAAHAAYTAGAWPEFTATQRATLLRKLAALIEDNADHLGRVEQRDNGKLITEVRGQVLNIAQWFYYYAGLADKVGGDVVPVNKPGVFNYTKYEPLGVVVAITPWNSPLSLTAWKMAPALAAGNTIVIKPSEHASASILELARLAGLAGFPKGVVNVVTGFGAEVGDPLVRHPLTRKIAFTGGDAGGQKVNEAAASSFKRVTLELGGKSPNVVFDDADLDQALKGVISGIFAAAGQTCMAGSRLLVQDSIHDEFVAQLVEVTRQARIGDPSLPDTQVGPIATRDQWERVMRMIEMAKADGATCVLGGHALSGEGYGQGQFVAPTIFTGVENDMRIARQEVFGPVLSVIRFRDEDDAIRLANDTEYGLAAAVWTKDLRRAMKCVDKIQAGTVWVNNYRTTSFTSPFGGYKRSGMGREGGVEAIKEYMQVKSVWITPSPRRDNPFVLG